MKLVDHVRWFGTSVSTMPPIEATRCMNGLLVINSGVTRATRAFRFCGPGVLVPVEVIDERQSKDVSRFPTVRDL